MDLRSIVLLEGSLHVKSADERVILSTLKDVALNIATLPNEFLHGLQAGVAEELRAREQCALSLTNEYWMNNEKMFVEKT